MKISDSQTIALYYKALLEKNILYVGQFYAAVKTTSIFCIPTCNARKPKFENVDYYTSPQEAIFDGYRPCKRCHPLKNETMLSELG